MKLAGNDILIQSLIKEGVEYIFGYPGGAALHIYDSIFNQNEMEHILVRHEQGATHAADGYARATGKPGVVLVTSGPGATNAITGIATAFMDSIPMIIISGQVAKHLIGTDAFQETDMIGISRPIVKHSFTVDSAENIPFSFTFLIGKSLGRFCSAKLLRQWCAELTNLPQWIIDESYESLGDNSETIALCFSKIPQFKNYLLLGLHQCL